MLQRIFGTALAAVAITGCVTGATLVRGPGRVSGPMLAGAVAADLLVTAAVSYQVQDFSAEASVATALTVTVVDTGVGCLFGGCSSLKP